MNKDEMIELIRKIAKEQQSDVVPRHQFLRHSHVRNEAFQNYLDRTMAWLRLLGFHQPYSRRRTSQCFPMTNC